MTRVAIIGAGSWGTALAISLANAGRAVNLWARRPELAYEIEKTRRNHTYLKESVMPDSIRVTSDLSEAITDTEMWVLATPSQSVRDVAGRLAQSATPELIVVSVSKGIENDTLLLSTQVLQESLPNVLAANIGVLYGPSHAEEVARQLPTAVVASADNEQVASIIQKTFITRHLRVYINTDLIGVQVGGSVKNVMAIAAGISDGVGFGDNAKAGLVTRGISEIRRLGLAMGAREATFSGLSGIGDLVVTCMSGLSRNRYLGEQIGRGKSLAEVEAEMQMVAEGVKTTRSVVALSRKYEIEMPITEAVYSILFENLNPVDAVKGLMGRSAGHEEWLPEE